MERYHRDIGLPENAEKLLDRFFAGFNSVRYSHHAKLETIHDRYGIIPVVRKDQLKPENCFELFVYGNVIAKAVFRVEGAHSDHCYSVSAEGIVVTCWTNAKDDAHATLDAAQYSVV